MWLNESEVAVSRQKKSLENDSTAGAPGLLPLNKGIRK
jgi:hypothetical protein